MNKIILTGRFVRDPEVRYSNGEKATAVARFSLAVERNFAKKGGDQPTADYPNCTAFGKQAEFVEKYFRKGMKAAIVGRIQTGSYTNRDGQKVYTTDVVVEQIEFCESKNSNSQNQQQSQIGYAPKSTAPVPMTDESGFMNIPDGIDAELPFS